MAVEYAIQDGVQHVFGCPLISSKLAGKPGEICYGAIKYHK